MPHLVFRVIDTGGGLRAGLTKSLFSPFATGETKPSIDVTEPWMVSSGSDVSDAAGVISDDSSASSVSGSGTQNPFQPLAPDGSASSVAKQKGSGLGLAMAEELTKQMGGSISLRTEQRRKRTVLEAAIPLRPPWRVIRRMEAGVVDRLPANMKSMQ